MPAGCLNFFLVWFGGVCKIVVPVCQAVPSWTSLCSMGSPWCAARSPPSTRPNMVGTRVRKVWQVDLVRAREDCCLGGDGCIALSNVSAMRPVQHRKHALIAQASPRAGDPATATPRDFVWTAEAWFVAALVWPVYCVTTSNVERESVEREHHFRWLCKSGTSCVRLRVSGRSEHH